MSSSKFKDFTPKSQKTYNFIHSVTKVTTPYLCDVIYEHPLICIGRSYKSISCSILYFNQEIICMFVRPLLLWLVHEPLFYFFKTPISFNLEIVKMTKLTKNYWRVYTNKDKHTLQRIIILYFHDLICRNIAIPMEWFLSMMYSKLQISIDLMVYRHYKTSSDGLPPSCWFNDVIHLV